MKTSPRVLATALTTTAALLLLPACGSTDSPGSQAPAPITSSSAASSASSVDRDLFNRVNDYRRSKGRAAVAWNTEMSKLAAAHSKAMAARNKLSHDGFKSRSNALRPAGITRMTENVYYISSTSDPAGAALKGWINSSHHNANMLERGVTQTGAGAATTPEGASYLTQIFGR